MTPRAALVTLAAVLAFASAGCRKPPATAATAGTGTAAPTDYRTLTMAGIEIIIGDKTGCPVTLKPAGPNKYTGTRQVPGETQPVPVTVTVEAERIVVETRGGGMVARDVITPRGVQSDLRE